MKQLLWLIAGMVLSGSVAAIAQDKPIELFNGLQGQLDIAGGTAHIPVMTSAAKKIMIYNPQIRISVAGGGSGVGVQKVGEGLVQIGNTGRPLKTSEIEKYQLVSFPFAIDGVAVVTHKSNPVKQLTRQQLIAIFNGEITNWRELAGVDGQINLYMREDGSGTREVFEEKALNNVKTTRKVNVVNSNGAMKTAISRDKNAIGYVGIGHLDQQINGLIIDGEVPSQQNAADGSYTVTRRLYMNTKGEPQGLAKAFIDYIYTSDGAEHIQQAGYIPIVRPQ